MKFRSKYWILLIIGLGLGLRMIHIDQSFWLDESISGLVAKNYSISKILFEFLKGDNHPPLFYMMLRVWGMLVGFSDFSLRLMPIIFATATIGISYLFISRLISRSVAILSSLFLATSPLHIYYSQELRMYPVVAFWVALLMYWYLELINSKAALWKWILFSLGLIVLVATDYTGIFMLPVFFILAFKEQKNRIKLFISFIPLGLAFLWWVPILIAQKETIFIQMSSLPGWSSTVGGATVKEASVLWMKFVLGRISFYPKMFYYLLVGFFSLPIIVSLFKSISQKSLWLWIYLTVPLLGSFITSVIVPSFSYFRFIYVLVAFYGLIAYGIGKFSYRARIVLISFILLGNIVGLGFYFGDKNNQREQWKQTVSYIESLQPDLVLFEFPEPFAPFEWYTNKTVRVVGGLTELSSIEENTRLKVNGVLSPTTKRVIYITYLRDLTDPEKHIQKVLNEQGYKSTFSESFAGVGEVILYVK